MPMRKQTLTILCYLALAACFSSFFWTLMIASGHVGAGKGLYVAGLMWCPAAAAIATCYIRRVDFKALGLRWGGARARLGRRNRLARVAHALGSGAPRFHQRQRCCRRYLGSVAHAAFAVRRLQQRNAVVVLDAMLLRTHDRLQCHHDVVSPGFEQRLALRNTACQSQLVHSGFLYAFNRISRHPDALCDR